MKRRLRFLLVALMAVFFVTFMTSCNQSSNRSTMSVGTYVINELAVVVDYDQTIEEMVDVFPYFWVHHDITAENFPIEKQGKAFTRLAAIQIHINMSTDEILVELKDAKMRPATLPELLAFGAKYPKLIKDNMIALGSSLEGKSFPTLLRGNFLSDTHYDYALSLWSELDNEWDAEFYFLAVRE